MGRLVRAGFVGVIAVACGGAAQTLSVGNVVGEARQDQLSFAAQYQHKGISFRGTVQKKGIKPSTASGFDFSGYGFGDRGGGVVVGTGQSRRINVNYGYVFVGEGSDESKRALCLFEPDNLREPAALQIGQAVTLTCLFSKFVGEPTAPTPVFWGCSVLD